DNENEEREAKGNQVINNIHTFDLALTYAVTERLDLTLGVPFQLAERSQVVTATNGTILERFSTRGDGLGDLRLLGSLWVFDPATHRKGNISLGLGVKFPTGENDARDTFHILDRTHGTITNNLQTIDQSIQPGDGGYGAILDLLAYRQISKST